MYLTNSATKEKGRVWEYRDNVDLYTEKNKEWVEEGKHHVDHILELQLLNKALYNTQHELIKDGVPSANTRLVTKQLQKVVNEPPILNVTTAKINTAKGGAVRSFLNRLDKDNFPDLSLHQFLRPKFESDSDIPHRIETSIVETYEDYVNNKIPEVVTNTAASDMFCLNLTQLVEKMRIGDE